MPATQFPARINVTSLTGEDGFVIIGLGGGSGYSVSKAGDINKDGIADLVVGAPYASSGEGESYVIFGESELGLSGSLDVASLNGGNGFAIMKSGCSTSGTGICGEIGYAVGSAGDINADGIVDLAIGAPWAYVTNPGDVGMAYVVFGKVGIGAAGTIDLESLNGSNGFSISGLVSAAGSLSGAAISSGDFNDDGIADLLLGAPYYSVDGGGYEGGACVIFGGSGVGSSGSLSLTNLNGANGFVMPDHNGYANVGTSATNAGDINHDGIADLALGGPGYSTNAGIVYVIFGQSGIGGSGTLSLAGLNGVNGFAITGFPGTGVGYGGAGRSISGVGDINGDGIDDLLIGAPYDGVSGECYVIFGQSGIGSSGSFNIASLNGSNGFVITGFATTSAGGSVSGIGDINDDGIVDFVIGSPGYSSQAAYVIFGQVNIGSSGTFSVASLVGGNGFTLIGFPKSSGGGYSVSGAGDVNGDGAVDFVVGAPDVSTGASYVIFGKQRTVSLISNYLVIKEKQTLVFGSQFLNATDSHNATMSASLLFTITNLQHGRFFLSSNTSFSLTQFYQQQVSAHQIQFAHDGSIWPPAYKVSVSYVNHPTIIAPQAAAITFQQSFVLLNNNLTVNQGQTVVLSASNISANDLYNSANNPNLAFSISNIQHGFFALTTAPSTSITSFTQAQIHSGVVQFVHDGSANPPSYDVTVVDGTATLAPQAATVAFDVPPTLVTNTLVVNQGQTVILNASYLSASDPYTTSFTFTVSNVQHGYFALTTAPATSITTFTQAQVQSGKVQFVHDGGFYPPSYSVSVSDGRMASTTQACVVSFDTIPVINNNSLMINQGQTVAITSTSLSATNPYNPAADLTFTINNGKHGYFSLTSASTIPITTFNQTQIQGGAIQFVHDGSVNAPSYGVSASDGRTSSAIEVATISFDATPVLINNSFTINQAQTVVLTSAMISASNPFNSAASLTFTVSDVQAGYFSLVSSPTIPITTFTPAQIQNGVVQFVQDGSSNAPSYNITVSDGRLTSASQEGAILFNTAPIIVNNGLSVLNGKAVTLSSANLSATNPNTSASSLTFTVSQVQHSQFALVSNPSQAITSFTEAQIENGEIQFIPDGSNQAPSYLVSVSDGKVSDLAGAVAATITFKHSPVLVTNQLAISQGQVLTLTSNDLSATDAETAAGSLIFTASSIAHGQFQLSGSSSPITSFPQQQITSAMIQFMTDGSDAAPAYSISVSDGMLSTAPSAAKISFVPGSSSADNTVRNAIIGATVSGGIGLLFVLLKVIMSNVANKNLQKLFQESGGDVERQQAEFHANVIRPIADKVFALISTTNIFGYRSDNRTKAYIAVIEDIVTKLDKFGVDIDLKEMKPARRIAVINEIAKQIKKHVVPRHDLCSKATLYRLVTEEASPEQIEIQSDTIAAAIQQKLGESIQRRKSKGEQISDKELQNDYTTEVVAAFANKIFERLKVVGICDCCCVNKDEYIDAVEIIVKELANLKINVDWSSLSASESQQLLNETAHQVATVLRPLHSGCTKFTSFFRLTGEVTPAQLEEHAKEIAGAVKAALPETFVDKKVGRSTKRVTLVDRAAIEMSDIKMPSPDPERALRSMDI